MRVKIGDVVDKIVGDEDRFTTELEYYIGGEHIDTSRIRVRKKGLLNSDKGRTLGYQFHYPFEPGDVLFMTKNPYLKKCGQVDFPGICSIATFVLRSKNEDLLLQDYLAVITQTDDFWNYLEANKSGSVNYFITWKTLEKYEFDLPSIEQQRAISQIILLAEELKTRYEVQLAATEEVVKSQFIEMFGDPISNPKGWQTKGLLEMGSCKNGMNFKAGDSGVDVYCLGVADFQDRSEIRDTRVLSKVSLKQMPREEEMLHDGDIVFVRSNGNKMLVGRSLVVFPGNIPTTYSGFCIRYRKSTDEVNTAFLLQMLKADSTRQKMAGRGANIQNLNQQILGSIDVPLPPLELQEEFEEFIKQSDKSKFEIRQSIKSLDSLVRSILEEHC